MRRGVLTAILAISAPVLAEPTDRLEGTGFLGLFDFADDVGLGGSLSPEQRPQTSPTFGARLTYIALRSGGPIHLDLGGEGELAFTPAWTGYGFESRRPSYFAPVFGYRVNLILRLGGTRWVEPHVTGGIGGETVVSTSPYMKKETDAIFLWGLGATFPMTERWQLRVDARQGLMESMSGGTTANYELTVAIGARFGLPRPGEPETHVEIVENQKPPPPPPEPDVDSDGDGIPDKLDKCPREPEFVNGVEDDDGCPEKDPDGDKLIGADDKCPDKAEDFDGFEDQDGCPDEDNDGDGIADATDKCPNQKETINGIRDDDGCPDQVPPPVISALESAGKVKFEANRPRLSDAGKAALDRALYAMLNNPSMKITIIVHPDKGDDKASELAKKRADVVKWYLVEQGIAEKHLSTSVGPVATKKAPLLELSLTP